MAETSDRIDLSYPYSRPSATCRGCGLSAIANCHPRASIEEFAKSLPEGWTYYPQEKAWCPECTRNKPANAAVDWNERARSAAAEREAKATMKNLGKKWDGTY